MNKIEIVGRLVADAELEETKGGVPFSRFRIASKSKQIEKSGKQKTDFFSCIVWRQQAESLCKYTQKGRQLFVTGYMTSRIWEKDDGTKQTVWEVNVEDVEFLESGKKTDEKGDSPSPAKGPKKKSYEELTPIDSQDLPF